jgi:hypothetical protein
VTNAGSRIEYGGEALFKAHRGLLSVLIAEPWIEFTPRGFLISVRHSEAISQRIHVAWIDVTSSVLHDHAGSMVTLQTNVTADGAMLFGSVYEAGTSFDPVTFVVPTEARSLAL